MRSAASIKDLYMIICHQNTANYHRKIIKILVKYDQNPTEMASFSVALAPGRPERSQTAEKQNTIRAPASTGAPFGVPFSRHLAHWPSKSVPKGAKRPQRDRKKNIEKAIDF